MKAKMANGDVRSSRRQRGSRVVQASRFVDAWGREVIPTTTTTNEYWGAPCAYNRPWPFLYGDQVDEFISEFAGDREAAKPNLLAFEVD
jgi:hypothetical protein